MPVQVLSSSVFVVHFTMPGPVAVGESNFVWQAPFNASIQDVRCSVGKYTPPASDDIIVDLFKWDSSSETWGSVYSDPVDRPKVLAGDIFGTPTVPDDVMLSEGDALSVEVVQSGGGATPTDEDLVVQVFLRLS
jgi:hypothetical protein